MNSPPPTPHPDDWQITAPLVWVCTLSALLVLGGWFPAVRFFAVPTHYLPLHTALEFVAMAISAMVFALGWNLRGTERTATR